MKQIITFFFTLIAFCFFTGCQVDRSKTDAGMSVSSEKPENIIFLIGDGMGLAQLSTAIYLKEGPSHFLRFTHTGFCNTSSASSKITDSAAGGTAFSTGVRTYNGAIAVGTDTAALKTIVEIVSESGYHTGVVSTSSITHATPASFYAHTPSRGRQDEIAAQLTRSDIDIFIGGGTRFFNNREDGLNYMDSLKSYNFEIAASLDDLDMSDPAGKYGILAAEDGMPPAHRGRGEFLPEATASAIDYLSAGSRKFFLMVEGSQIDWGGHQNDSSYVVSEMLDFDKTLAKALDFAEKDGKTLVVVTADHETGGMALAAKSVEGMGSDYNAISPVFATGGHTATLVPVLAYGPGAEAFTGIYDNTEIFHKMVELLGTK